MPTQPEYPPMAASTGSHSWGTAISYCATSNGSYVELAEVIDGNDDYSIPGTDFSHLKSDNAAKEKKPSMIEPGEITLKLTFTKAMYAILLGFGRTQKYWKITLADGSVIGPAFGHVSKLGTAFPFDERITNDVTIMKSGAPAFTAAV